MVADAHLCVTDLIQGVPVCPSVDRAIMRCANYLLSYRPLAAWTRIRSVFNALAT